MRRLLFMAVGMLITLACLACKDPPIVFQGKTISYEETTKLLTAQDERSAETISEFVLEGAEVGKDPVAGDLVRISYRVRDGKNMAIRVMNLTRQSEVSGAGH